jgi:hypothetical protein
MCCRVGYHPVKSGEMCQVIVYFKKGNFLNYLSEVCMLSFREILISCSF